MRLPVLLLLLLPVPASADILALDAAVWEAPGPLPESEEAGSDVRYVLVLRVHPLRPPSSIPVKGADDGGGSVRVDPPVVSTFPGRETYRVNVTWRPAVAGVREVVVEGAGAEHRLRVEVRPVEALLALEPGEGAADWRLPVVVRARAAVAETTPLRIHGRWTDGEAGLAWEETGPMLPVSQEESRTNVTVTLRYGPGRYEFHASVAGDIIRGRSPVVGLVASPASPSAEAPAVVIIPDSPLQLALTSDSVNENGKLKRPGEALITRLRVTDANGLGGLSHLTFEVSREGKVLNVTRHVPEEDRWARTALEVEHRFSHSPLRAGPYLLRATAWNGSGPEASVSRTFEIRPVQADLGELQLDGSSALTDRPWEVRGTGSLASRNWAGPGDAGGVAHLRVYRGTSQVSLEAQLANVTGSTPLRVALPAGNHSILGERGAQTLPIGLAVPAGTNGSLRVSLLWSAEEAGTPVALASWTLTARAPPSILRLEARGEALPGTALPVEIEIGGAWEGATLRLGNATVAVEASPARVELPVPRLLPAGTALRIEAEVQAAGRVAAVGLLPITVANAPPEARLLPRLDGVPADPLRILPGVARELRVAIAAWDQNGDHPSALRLALVDWNGVTVAQTLPVAQEGGAEGVLDLPAALPPGRYRVLALVRDAAGAEAEVALPALVGGWAAVRASPTSLSPSGGKLVGTLRVENAGTIPLRAVAVELSGSGPLSAPATLRLGALSSAEGDPLLLPVPLAPGGSLEVTVELPLAADAAPGRTEGRIRVLAVAEGTGW